MTRSMYVESLSHAEVRSSVQTIASTYGVSERLLGMMCTKPVFRPPKPTPSTTKRHSQHDVDVARDLENAFPLKGISDQDASHDPAASQKLTFAQVTDQIWHFSSVDHGPRCRWSRADAGEHALISLQIPAWATIRYTSSLDSPKRKRRMAKISRKASDYGRG